MMNFIRVHACSSVVFLLMLAIAGCGRIDPESVPPLRVELAFGSAGRSLGQFNVPRSIAIDYEREFIYIVDRSALSIPGCCRRVACSGSNTVCW